MATQFQIRARFAVAMLLALLVAIGGYATNDDSLFQFGILAVFVLTLVGGFLSVSVGSETESPSD